MISMEFKINPQAKVDIQEHINYYNEQQSGLGARFHRAVKVAFKTIHKSPFFQIRYANVRCYPLKKFPIMIHFTVDENKNEIVVRAVFHTSQNPDFWKSRL
jgi:toxin ParE1/3/4